MFLDCRELAFKNWTEFMDTLKIYLFYNLHDLAQVLDLLVKVLLVEDAFPFLRVGSLCILLLLIQVTLLFF